MSLPQGTLEVFTEGPPGQPLSTPNWGCFGGDSSYYFTDSGEWGASNGALWVVAPGRAATVWTSECKAFPNGCAMALGGKALSCR